MVQFLLQSFFFLLASLITITLIYINSYYKFYQPLIPVLLVIDILIVSRINTKQGYVRSFPKLTVLLISSVLVQLIIISSGGFYSPLLILLHLFTIGAIFVLNSSSPISFLIFSLGVLVFHIWFDSNLSQFFRDDPWTTVIYGLSIIIVIPLALFLSHNNSAKNSFTNFLKDYIYMSESRQKSILTALSNLVIITDKNLSIVSVNTALERLLRLSAPQVIGKPIFEFIKLRDSSGSEVSPETLPVKQALSDRATHFAEGYSLVTKIQTLPKSVTIQIKPVANTRGDINQIIFVFTDPTVKIGFNTHPTIQQAAKKHEALLKLVSDPKSVLTPSQIQLLILEIAHIEDDILTVQEMEDHPLQEVIGFEDMVVFINKIIASKNHFLSLLGTSPKLIYEDDNKSEAAFLTMNSSESKTLDQGTSALSKYSAPIDGFLLKIIIEKIIDLGSFIASSQAQNSMEINMKLVDSDKTILIDFKFPSGNINASELPNLFLSGYPNLKFPALKDSSGLEGYIANKIAKTIQLEFVPSLNPYTKTITISIALSKQAKIT